MILLQRQECVYSSAPEMHAKDKAAAVAREIKARDLFPDLDFIMEVPDFNNTIIQQYNIKKINKCQVLINKLKI